MNKDHIYESIRARGGRITKIRKEILEILSSRDCLLSQTDLLLFLKKKALLPNRSTIFRELLFLVKNNIAVKNTISGVDYYEIPHGHHHHHLICLKCRAISKVEIDDHLKRQTKQIASLNKFEIINHSLEFYGYCRKCQS